MFQKSNTAKQTYIPDLWLTVTVYDQHNGSVSHFTAVLPSALLPIPTVTLWDVTSSPRYYRKCGPHYRGFSAVNAVFPPSPLLCRPLVDREHGSALNDGCLSQWSGLGGYRTTSRRLETICCPRLTKRTVTTRAAEPRRELSMHVILRNVRRHSHLTDYAQPTRMHIPNWCTTFARHAAESK